jgi:hypothetical protein
MIRKMAATLTLALIAATPWPTIVRADDVLDPEVNLTREQWLARVEQAKQRARLANEIARIVGSTPARTSIRSSSRPSARCGTIP